MMISVERLVDAIEKKEHWNVWEIRAEITRLAEPSTLNAIYEPLKPGEHADPPSVGRHEVDDE